MGYDLFLIDLTMYTQIIVKFIAFFWVNYKLMGQFDI